MSRAQLPKAYLRIDPNVDQTHPDNLGEFVRLLCAANRQPQRGVFAKRTVLLALFGKRVASTFLDRGDVVERADGSLYVPGWQEWQEGDWTVAERQQRIRARRDNGVTESLHGRTDGVTPPVTLTVTDVLRPIDTPNVGTSHEALGHKGEGRKASDHALEDDGPDALDAYFQLTAKPPTGRAGEWLRRLVDEWGDAPVAQALGAEAAADSDLRTLLSRTEYRLGRQSDAAEQARRDAERRRQEDERKRIESMPPEKRAANLQRLRSEMAAKGLI